jgi:hypothetical protein
MQTFVRSIVWSTVLSAVVYGVGLYVSPGPAGPYLAAGAVLVVMMLAAAWALDGEHSAYEAAFMMSLYAAVTAVVARGVEALAVYAARNVPDALFLIGLFALVALSAVVVVLSDYSGFIKAVAKKSGVDGRYGLALSCLHFAVVLNIVRW